MRYAPPPGARRGRIPRRGIQQGKVTSGGDAKIYRLLNLRKSHVSQRVKRSWLMGICMVVSHRLTLLNHRTCILGALNIALSTYRLQCTLLILQADDVEEGNLLFFNVPSSSPLVIKKFYTRIITGVFLTG